MTATNPSPSPNLPNRPEITAVILTYNEAAHVQACIQSLRWADRVVVFDSFSQDETMALAQAAGADPAPHEAIKDKYGL